jgi:hypothetical protein
MSEVRANKGSHGMPSVNRHSAGIAALRQPERAVISRKRNLEKRHWISSQFLIYGEGTAINGFESFIH